MTVPRIPAPTRPAPSCLVACAAIAIAASLTIIGLFLPPFSLANRLLSLPYTALAPGAPAQTFFDELRLSRPADDSTNFSLKVARLASPALEDSGGERPAWLAAALAELPADLSLRSPLYLFDYRGEAADSLRIELSPPPELAALNRISLHGWDGETWRFMPASRSDNLVAASAQFLPKALALFEVHEQPPGILVSQEVMQDLRGEIAELATILSPAGLRPTGQAGLIGSLAPGGSSDAGYLFMPLIRNFSDRRAIDRHTVERIISQPALRREHIKQLSNLTQFNSFDGVFIDYRGFSAAYRDHFTRFISDLSASLSQSGLRLGLVVPAEWDGESENWHSGAYDWLKLGAAADFFQVRAPLHPLDFAPDAPTALDELLRAATSAVDRRKIFLTLSVRSLREVGELIAPIGWDEAFAALGDVILDAEQVSETGTIEPGAIIRASLSGYPAHVGIDSDLQLLYLDYFDESGTGIARIWLTDAAALEKRLARIRSFAIAGIALDDILADEHFAGLQQVIASHKSQQPADPAPNLLQARWSIDAAGGSLDEIDAGLDEELVMTLEAPDGHYAVNWNIIAAGGVSSARKGAVLPLFEPTPTPTPTATPTPLPRPVIAAPANAPVTSFDSGPPPSGSIRIAIGGHVTETYSPRAIGPMRSAGMTWMKKQVRFDWHGPQDVGPVISAAHGNGFKVLIGTVGHPHELQQGGQAYIDSYTSWLQRIAGQGADAIEVWNEPNIDREWPRGQISGVAYAKLLASAYQKIKQANPNTMVISAAPAPTGIADNPERVMPDNRWLRQMVEGGGLNYLDCVGAHYNEGIVPPSQTSGDPRGDNYYTRYFYGMLNGYISITRKPICFTELGYLTSDGLPNLPPYFSWAQDVTLQQQATWLAQAAALASRSGQVPLFIVWNIDFTHYGADPQAGYAIVRPDGSCPACNALAAAR